MITTIYLVLIAAAALIGIRAWEVTANLYDHRSSLETAGWAALAICSVLSMLGIWAAYLRLAIQVGGVL